MGKKTTERVHALLSASSAKKWLYCTPSAVLEDTLPEDESYHAKEGTLAHAISELKLIKLFIDKNMTDRMYKSRHKKLQGEELYQSEMETYTDEYVDYVSAIAFGLSGVPFVAVEKKLDYSPWVPEGFGTGDCIIIYGNEMHIIDFKYGKGVSVQAEENPQMALYGLGAWHEYGVLFGIEKVHFHIVQPRIKNNSCWTIPLKELLDWGESFVKPRAALAFKGEGMFLPGVYCKEGFCKAYGRCRATANKYLPLQEDAKDKTTGETRIPPLLTNEEVGDILQRAKFLKDWVGKLETYAQNELLKGHEIPGWKLVEGRSQRELSHPDQVFAGLIAAGYDEAVLYNKKPVSLGELEKLITKEQREDLLLPYIVKPQGKPTLVPAEDKRPAMNQGVRAEDAFGGENTYKKEEK